MVTRKTKAIAFIGILITAGLVVFVTQVQAQTPDEQQQALIGEWKGVWAGGLGHTGTLIIHEIDTTNAKARCTFTSSYFAEKKYPVLADFTPGPEPKLEFKVEGNEFKFVLRKNILQGARKGIVGGFYSSNTIKMEK
jgi:hypothetical protein